MRKLLLCSALALLAAACKDGGSTPSVATTVTLTPGTVSLNAIGAKQVVHAAVVDQKGKAMDGAAVNWSSSSGAVTVASAGGDSAIVTAAANGSASITAASGGVSGGVTVQVAQTPTTVQKASGDAQTGTAGAALPQPVTVGVRDRLGGPVAGVTVTFSAVGGGTLSAASAVTGANGNAAVTWTLGTAAGSLQRVNAAASVGSVEFNATAVAGAPTTASVAAGNNQVGLRSAAVATPPRVLVRDALGNPVAGVAVQFAVTSGGGAVTGAAQTTDVNGSAAVTSWTLGATSGANSLTVTFPGTAVPAVVFNATAAVAGTLSVQNGQNWATMAGTAIPAAPTVVVRDGLGNPVAGMEVTFTILSGGGSVGNATAVSNSSGVASAGSWTLGPQAGPNTLRASVSAITASPVVFRGTGCTGGGGTGYEMTLCFTTSLTTAQRAAFTSAASRWAGIISADLPDIEGGISSSTCGPGSPAMDHNFDDLLIFAGVETIDGPGAILGQAGWCYRRAGGGLPVIGVMTFDVADMNGMEADGSLNAVILHEMGHVMGIGTLWSQMGLLHNPSSSSVLDTYFSGAQALVGFNAIGGSTYAAGQKVPVENTGGAGTANAHWRESVLGRELMTGYLNAGANPLSELTVRSLTDLGYTVNVAKADAYSILPALRAAPNGHLDLGNDLYTGPRFTIDRQGRRTRIR